MNPVTAASPMQITTAPALHWRTILACALAALGLQGAAQARCTASMMELPVKMVGHRAIATIGINGTKVPMVVDSGAFFSILTGSTAAQLKLPLSHLPFGMEIQGVAGNMADARKTTVKDVQLLDGELHDIDFVVGGNELDAGGMGLLGRNFLAATDVEYDLAHGMIRLVWPSDECAKTSMAYWAGDTPVSQIELLHERENRSKIPAIRTTLELNGHKTIALFDTGATTMVSLSAAHKAGVKDADMTPDGELTGVGRGKAGEWTADFDRVQLGGEAVLHNRLEVGDYDMADNDMLIGIDFFLSHRLYVSKKQWRMYFTYNGGPVFALNKGEHAAPPATASSAVDTLTADEHARRGAASLARGDVAAALADLDRACAMEPDNADFHISRAAVYLRRSGGGGKALAELDTALRLDPGRIDARRERAMGRFANGQADLALDDLAILDKTLPPQSQVRADMGRLYESMNMPAQAIAQWNLWIAAHPHDITLEGAYNARCWARAELGIELDKALADCDEAIDANPKNASYLDSRAWVLLRQGKPRKSLADFDRGLAIKPDGAWSLYGRGLAHLGLGETAPAQADMAAARTADPLIDAQVGKAGLPTVPEAKKALP